MPIQYLDDEAAKVTYLDEEPAAPSHELLKERPSHEEPPPPVVAPFFPKAELSPYEKAQFESLQAGRGLPETGMEAGTELLTEIGRSPVGFVKALPAIAGGVVAAPGKLAYEAAADVIAKATGDREYGGNIPAMMRGETVLPSQRFLGEVAKVSPQLAVVGRLGEAGAGMAGFAGMGFLPATVNRLIAAGFSASMIAGAGSLAREYGTEMGKPESERDPDKLAQLRSDMIQTGIFAPLAGAGATRGLVGVKPEFQGPLPTGSILRPPAERGVVTAIGPEILPPPGVEVPPPIPPPAPTPAITKMTRNEAQKIVSDFEARRKALTDYLRQSESIQDKILMGKELTDEELKLAERASSGEYEGPPSNTFEQAQEYKQALNILGRGGLEQEPLPELTTAKPTPAPRAIPSLPAVEPGFVRVFSGTRFPGSKSSWFTTNVKRAGEFAGDRGEVNYVDVPKEEFDAAAERAKEGGSFTPGDALLSNKWVNQAKSLREELIKRSRVEAKAPELYTKTAEPPPEKPVVAITPTLVINGKNYIGESHAAARKNAVAQGVDEADAIIAEANDAAHKFIVTENGVPRPEPLTREEAAPIFDKIAGNKEGTTKSLRSEDLRDAGLLKHLEEAKAPPSPPSPTPPATTAKEPWQMTAVEARRTFPTLTQEKWDAAVTAAWKDGRLTEDSAPVQSMMRSKPRDFGEIDAVLNGRMQPSDELLKRHPDLAPKPSAPAAETVPEEPRRLNVRFGESHRQYKRQMDAFKAAGIELRDMGSYTLGGKAQMGVIPDTPEARALAKKTGMTISRRQWDKPPPMKGPGAAPLGEVPPTAAQQLIDQMRAAAPEGTRERLSWRQGLAAVWARNKAAFDRATAQVLAIGESIKDTARGVRTPTDVDRKLGELDWLLQKSSAQSRQIKPAIENQQRNPTTRRAAALWMDTPGTDIEKQATLRDALANLPEGTPDHIRQTIEVASQPTPELRQFVESLRQYYGIREQDAVTHGIFGEIGKDGEIIKGGLDDYFTHVWGKESNMPDGLRAAISNGRVNNYFQFARQRKIGMFLEGILQGKVPELDPAKVLPYYNYALDRSIASRQFIKELTDNIVASDGRAALVPTGTVSRIGEAEAPEATLIRPKGRTDSIADYRPVDHPALRKWKWLVNDENGNPVLSMNDLLVHPEFYERVARMMDRVRLMPTRWGRRALRASTEVKGLKLGLLSAFHQVHVGSHALFHWTLPFNFKDPRYFTEDGHINWEAPDVKYAVEKGHLKLAPDPSELNIYAEGLAPGSLVQNIPILGPWSRMYSEFVFGDLIPKLKLKTFANALPRNLKHYAGKFTEEEIAARVGDSVNNAYGELNSLFLGKVGRDPRFQRILRGIFLAPDFGEARLRFVEKAFTKAGFEERLALATMFMTLYTAARAANWLSHGDPEMDTKNAFSVKVGEHWYSMRSVLGDLTHALTNPGQFFYVRLNPLYSRTAADWLFGRDINGRKLSPMEKFATRPMEQLIPIQFGALTRDDQALWESAITAMGLSARGDSPQQDIRTLSRKWMASSPDPKIQAEYKRNEQSVYPPSDYNKLRFALRHNNERDAQHAYDDLIATRTPDVIREAMLPNKPFTGSWAHERKFKASLTPAQQQVYEKAMADRREQFARFNRLRRTKPPSQEIAK